MTTDRAAQAVGDAIRTAQRAAAPATPPFEDVCRAAVEGLRAFDALPYPIPAAMTLADLERDAWPLVGMLAYVVEGDDVTIARVEAYHPLGDPEKVGLAPIHRNDVARGHLIRRRGTFWRELEEVHPTYAHACFALAHEAEETRATIAAEERDARMIRDRFLATAADVDAINAATTAAGGRTA